MFYSGGSTANVADRGLASAEKKDCRSEIFEFSVSSADSLDTLDHDRLMVWQAQRERFIVRQMTPTVLGLSLLSG